MLFFYLDFSRDSFHNYLLLWIILKNANCSGKRLKNFLPVNYQRVQWHLWSFLMMKEWIKLPCLCDCFIVVLPVYCPFLFFFPLLFIMMIYLNFFSVYPLPLFFSKEKKEKHTLLSFLLNFYCCCLFFSPDHVVSDLSYRLNHVQIN